MLCVCMHLQARETYLRAGAQFIISDERTVASAQGQLVPSDERDLRIGIIWGSHGTDAQLDQPQRFVLWPQKEMFAAEVTGPWTGTKATK